MSLAPKALTVLASIRNRLLAEQSAQIVPEYKEGTPEPPKKAQPKPLMRHARQKNQAFQAMCRRRDWAAPIF